MRKLVCGAFLLLAGYALFSTAIWRLTDGFSLCKIQSELHPSPLWETPCYNEESIKNLLSQNFYYIGKGSQCYVFESEDHDVVLKFFRYPRYFPSGLIPPITTPTFMAEIQKKRIAEKQRKLDALFESCLLAYRELREETQLIYLHLNKTNHLKQTVILYDKLKRPFPIAIDRYEFMIQKKGQQIFPYLTQLLKQGKKQEAKLALANLASLLNRRLQKGIIDTDAVIHKNSGFRGQKALFLDVGGFKHGTPNYHLERTTLKLRTWLQAQDPELATFFEQTLLNTSKASHHVCNESPLLLKSIHNIQAPDNLN